MFPKSLVIVLVAVCVFQSQPVSSQLPLDPTVLIGVIQNLVVTLTTTVSGLLSAVGGLQSTLTGLLGGAQSLGLGSITSGIGNVTGNLNSLRQLATAQNVDASSCRASQTQQIGDMNNSLSSGLQQGLASVAAQPLNALSGYSTQLQQMRSQVNSYSSQLASCTNITCLNALSTAVNSYASGPFAANSQTISSGVQTLTTAMSSTLPAQFATVAANVANQTTMQAAALNNIATTCFQNAGVAIP